MNKITFPLGPGKGPTVGSAVADLQDTLLLCLARNALLATNEGLRREFWTTLLPEREQQTYGNTTGRLVSAFQSERNLQASGGVDEPTANALNALLKEWGVLDQPAAQSFVVSGQVRREDGLPLQGMGVRAVYEADAGSLRLGEDTTDAEGRYTIRYEPVPGIDGINLRVTVFDADGKPLHDSDVISEAKTLEIVDLIVPGSVLKPYHVEGKVASRASAGVGGLRVVIVDKGVGGDVQLAETTTNDGGAYQATFSDSDVRQRGKAQPDLQARVFAGDAFLGASDVHYNASQHETLHVLLDDKATSALPSEHEVLTSALASQFKGKLGDLKETDEQQDITYLANKTGWDARAVALAALADQFSARTMDTTGAPAIPQAFFYALFRAGLPANEDVLYHTDAKTLEAVWKTAAEQGVIPKASVDQIPNLIGRFQALSAQKLLTGPALVGTSSFKEMLTVSGLDGAQDDAQKFAQLYAANRADLPAFWQAVTDAFGPDKAKRLQVDGKLGFLTINNAPLMQKVQAAAGANGLSDPLELAQMGYHRADMWSQLLTADVPIPKEIPGDTETRRANYASYLAAQVRLSYPTVSVVEMISNADPKLRVTFAGQNFSDEVSQFLTEHQGEFEIGVQPVQQYLAQNNVQVADETVRQVKRLQRVYQITPSDDAMRGLLQRGIDAAYHVVRYDKDTFVQSFAGDVGGADHAALTYDKSVQVHNAVLNIALSYLNARTAPAVGVHSPSGIIDPAPANAGDVIANATLESLFGSMDFCACDHCRSILSPAAYLVDLLLFLDKDPPPGSPAEIENPQNVLLEHRPDIQHLPLTCENTNTALPYIDVVNETLEYFVANTVQKLSLNGYVGNDTGTAASEDLLASPQFVMDTAYTLLQQQYFPAPLPFHQPLENLRRYFNAFSVPLPLAMERLRKADDLERGEYPYGWRDILMEEIGLSRDEYEILTDSNAVPLWRMYGFPNGTADADVIAGIPTIAGLSHAKQFTRRIGLTYDDIVGILRTKFVNPNSDLIPKLERLGVPFSELKKLKDTNTPDADAAFDALLPSGADAPDPAEYGGDIGDIKAWVKRQDNYDRIMKIITLTDPTANPDPCSFDNLEFRYSKPMTDVGDISTRLGAVEFVRLLRFIRLWKKLGWTIEQVDAAICALYRVDLALLDASDINDVTKLDTGFLTLLPRIGIVLRVMKALNLTVNRDLLPLLACWSDIGTHGEGALYRQMFLNPALLKQDTVFADNGFGEFLHNSPEKLLAHAEALRSAFNLTGDEFDLIIKALGFNTVVDVPYTHPQPSLEKSILDVGPGIGYDNQRKKLSYTGFLSATTRDALKSVAGATADFQAAVDALYLANQAALRPLTLMDISAIFRRGWLARKLRLSVRELLLLSSLIGLDPFAAPDPTNPAILQLISLVQALKDRSFKSAATLYLIWNQDLSGKSAPDPAQLAAFARTLRLGLADVEGEFAVADDPDGTIARARMALVYGNDATNLFFGFLDNTFVTDVQYNRAAIVFVTQVPYHHDHTTLEQAILDAASNQIAYDDTTTTLSFTGILTDKVRNALKKVAGVTDAFKNAVDALYTENQQVVQANLEQPIVESVPGRIYYDDFRKRLYFSGILTDNSVIYTDNILDTLMNVKVNGAPLSQEFTDALHNLYQENKKVVVPFFARYPELQPLYDAYVSDTTHSAAEKRSTLLKAILPELVQRRKRQQALQSVSAMVNIDLAFTQALLDPPAAPFPLHAVGHGDQPALNDLLALETPGLSVKFFANDTATGAIIKPPDIATMLDYSPAVGGIGNPLPVNPTIPGAAISGIWDGYLEAQESGLFKLSIVADAGATVTLRLLDDKGRPVTLIQDATDAMLWHNKGPIELRAGTLYPVSLTVEKVRNVVRVEWEWEPKGQGHAVIPARYLYPATLFDSFQETYVRFLKAASLATGLSLTANEIGYFATHSDYQIDGDGWLNALSVSGNPAPSTAPALLKPFEALLDFARIKVDISASDESLLTVLKDPTTATQNTDSLLFTITRWNQTSLNDVLAQFSGTMAGLGHFELFRRVYDAFALIQKMGISAKALIQATTNEPTSDTVRDLQAALRARYAAADWRDVVRPINDEMRGLQRDALVAYILHQMRSNPESAHIDTADKLFEYFLTDVQMDPCMQTSRIRHALSSVQLFIERCLMNLEPRVSPEAINPKQWEWMRRYRVWEANRKVYLFPENWLEPELRDDKSPFFKEIESELLQSDITEERAAIALLNYLSKLEEVAKLEPCGIYYIPPADPDSAKRTGEINHVVARTAGAHRKYYYRRYEYGSWTPWEQIKLDIEGNPVIPVVWKDRLFLFWLRILKQTSMPMLNAPWKGTTIQDLDASTVIEGNQPQVEVRAILCWSEYYNGKWQATKTSDVNDPVSLGSFSPFDRPRLGLWSDEPQDGQLRITIYGDLTIPAFLLYNTHSLPQHWDAAAIPPPFGKIRRFENVEHTFKIDYHDKIPDIPDNPLPRDVLTDDIPMATVQPNHYVSDTWDAPFFFEDSRNVFYVTSEQQPVWVADSGDFGVSANPAVIKVPEMPPLVVRPGPPIQPKFWGDGGPLGPDTGVIDLAPMQRFVTEDAYIRQGIGTTAVVRYGDRQIGPSGALMNVQTGR